MKILSLAFANINSLKGEHRIDFTETGIARDGIFAITGPTGSGKTSILDAICVALYGRTPRLGQGQSVHELMSRHSTSCRSEVEFSLPMGRYRSSWEIHRASNKSSGKIQAATMRLEQLREDGQGVVLCEKIREVLQEIEKLTGLDYERFCRSMMLAQGDFAAFLQASAASRAQLLEKMTATNIYTRISQKTHERHRDEVTRLELAEAKLSGNVVLTSEERGLLEKEYREQSERRIAVQKDLQKLRADIQLREMEAQLSRDELQLVENEKQLLKEQTLRQDDMQRLMDHERAIVLQPTWARLQELAAEIEQYQHDLLAGEETQQQLTKELKCREALKQQAEVARNEFIKLRPRKDEQLSELARLDERLAGEATATLRQNAELGKLDEEIARLKSAEKLVSEEEATARKELARLENEDAEVPEDIAMALQEIDGWQAGLNELLRRHTAGEKACVRLQDQVDRCQLEKTAAENGLADTETAFAALGTRLETLSEAHRELCTSGDRRGLDAEVRRLNEVIQGLARIVPLGERFEQRQAIEKKLQQQVTEQNLALLAAQNAVGQAQKDLEACQVEMERCEDVWSRRRREQDLAEQRSQLLAGEPCPLCGALEHPWQNTTSPDPDQAETAFEQARAGHAAAAEVDRRSREALAALGAERKSLSLQLVELTRELEQARTQWDELSPDRLPETWPLMQEEITATREKLGGIETQRDHLQKLETELQEVQTTWKVAEAGLQQHRQNVQQTSRSFEEKTAELTDVTAESLELFQTLEERRLTIRERLLRAGIATTDDLDRDCQELRNQVKQRDTRRARIQKLLGEILPPLKEKLSGLKVGLANLRQQHVSSKVVQAERIQRVEELQAERFKMGGETPLQELRQRINDQETTLQSQLDQARTEWEESCRNLAILENSLKELTATAAKRQRQWETMSAEWKMNLSGRGFADETAFLAVLLDESQAAEWIAWRTASQQKQAELLGVQKDVLRRRQQMAVVEMPDDELTVLQAALVESEARERELGEQFGAIQDRLTEDDRRRKLRSEEAQACELLRLDVQRWAKLDEMIGSARGDKFSQFAQGLTMEALLDRAGKHLSRFNSRYLLQRSGTDRNGLEIEVVDGWQADEIRPTSNLSGGESFQVSLALALGLSELASRSISIESLFLDEGFGTLDPEALESALLALSAVQTSGRVIGIISHVEALKSAVPCRIEVIRQAGGSSVLQIVG